MRKLKILHPAPIKCLISLSLFLLTCTVGFSQKKFLEQEFQVESDNDNYTLDVSSDRYYSSGLAIRYRVLKDPTPRKWILLKIIRSYELNHRIFTPKKLYWTEIEELDRPYAGQLSVAASNEYFYKNNTYLKVKGELGWMGPALKTGKLQYNWHKIVNTHLPRAWEYEINNGPIINAYATYAKTMAVYEHIDVTSEANLALGTTFNHLKQEFIIRIGKFKPIQTSTQYNGVLGIENNRPANYECYFFVSPGIAYVAYDATIEGQLIGQSSIHTEERVPWVYQTRAGIMAGWTKFDLALLYYQRTKETTESTFHKCVGIRMARRF